MLVLTRRLHESVDIGDDIRITIVRLNAIEVRIGIEAPDHVHIKRSELLDDKDNPWPGIRSSE